MWCFHFGEVCTCFCVFCGMILVLFESFLAQDFLDSIVGLWLVMMQKRIDDCTEWIENIN